MTVTLTRFQLCRLLLRFAAGLVLLACGAAHGQYPSRPVRIIVMIPPGGAPDIVARVIGEKLTTDLGQPFVIENRAGANGNIAGEMVARAAPDGHTLLLAADSLITINPHLYPAMSFSTLDDLAPVATLGSNQFVLSVHPSVPAKNLREFIDHARRANPPLNYASGGNGSQHQIAMELLKSRAGINLVHVPYSGGSPATLATVAGEVAVMFAGSSTAGQIKAGKLRALAVTGAARSSDFPDLPAIAEMYPNYEVTIWIGLFAPAHTPASVLNSLRTEINRTLALPEFKARLNAAGGLTPYVTTLVEFSSLIRRDHTRYGKLVKETGIKPD
jgi:tripartite-type tricarboxylate transporter receptor subunit TctC